MPVLAFSKLEIIPTGNKLEGIIKNHNFKKYSAHPLHFGVGFFYSKKKCLTKQSFTLYKKVYTIKHKGVYYGYYEHFER